MRVIDETLFHPTGAVTDRAPVLAGSRCPADRTVVFPAQGSCPRCSQPDVAVVALPARGTLWSWTVQQFPPKAPFRAPVGGFTPYPVGYVNLGDVIVEGRLQVADGVVLSLDAPMALVWAPVWTDPDGTDVLSYAFAPVPEAPGPEGPGPEGPGPEAPGPEAPVA